ncbi:MAG: flagellar filament outer layer protein FlaA [Spirochaetales bacterium]|nr:flagellar filament outer layer protein FlaA [Spirochaetales bacterium]
MKKLSVLCFFLIGMCMFLFVGNVFADENVENIETWIVDDFDSGTQLHGADREWTWVVRGSKFITKDEEGNPLLKHKLVDGYPDALYSRQDVEGKEVRVLGIEGGFDRRGYNYLEIIPVAKDEEGNLKSHPIELKGRVKSIDLWAWGAGYNYYLEVHLLDGNGLNYHLVLGDLAFKGWKNLSVAIPTAIPQHRRYVNQKAALSLTKLVVWTQPTEKVDEFRVFIDQLKIITDTFISKFDGDELADPDVIEKLWTEGEDFQGN